MNAIAPDLHLSADALYVYAGKGSEKVGILHGCSHRFAKGEFTAIVGPNGAGKSTLLRHLGGIFSTGYAHTGTVTLDGIPLLDMPNKERAKRIAWLEQSPSLSMDRLPVYDVVMLGRLPHIPMLGAAASEDHTAVQNALELTQAWGWRHRPIQELSGGERQRVLLSRALAVEADTLLLDEPLSYLDPPHQADCIALAHQLRDKGKTVVMVLHELHHALYADQMLVMQSGRIVHAGSTTCSDTHHALEAVFDHRIRIAPLPASDGNTKTRYTCYPVINT